MNSYIVDIARYMDGPSPWSSMSLDWTSHDEFRKLPYKLRAFKIPKTNGTNKWKQLNNLKHPKIQIFSVSNFVNLGYFLATPVTKTETSPLRRRRTRFFICVATASCACLSAKLGGTADLELFGATFGDIEISWYNGDNIYIYMYMCTCTYIYKCK